MVDSGLIFLGCRNIKKDYNSGTSTYESIYDKFGTSSNRFSDEYLMQATSMLNIAKLSTVSSIKVYDTSSGETDKTLSVNIYKSILKNNTYTYNTLGVTYIDGTSNYVYMGSLINLMHIMAATIDNETFENIGAFT